MIACAILIVLLGAALAMAVAYARELQRVARFLSESGPESNERLDMACPLPGCAQLTRAVDARLEADREILRRRAAEDARFQQELASLSHDIRTPLAGAKGYVQLALDEADASERSVCLASAVKRMDTMQALLDQLFAYTRSMDVDAVRDIQEVDARELLASALAGAHPLFEEQGREVEVRLDEAPIIVRADPEALRRIFDNVIRNAIEHGTGPLRIEQEECALVFSNDIPHGVSIDADRVMERFYQADASRGTGNAGLGLATVQNLCTAMGMQATVHVADGAFTLRLWHAGQPS